MSACEAGSEDPIVKLCLTGSDVHFTGKLFRVDGFRLGVPPSSNIPVFGAAMGTKIAEKVARFADGVLAMLVTLEQVREIKKTIEYASTKYQLERSPALACHIVTSVSKASEEAERVAKQTLIRYLEIPVYRNSIVRMGFEREVQAIESTKKSPDGWKDVPDGIAERLIVYGTPEECTEKIYDFQKAGVEYPVIYPCDSGGTADVNETIEFLAPFLGEAS